MKFNLALGLLVCALAPVHSARADQTDWSRVRRLKPGTSIVLVIPSVEREYRFVTADELTVTVVTITDAGEVAQRIDRAQVIEVRRTLPQRGSILGAIVGGWAGFSLGVVPGLGGASPAVTWTSLIVSTAAGSSMGYRPPWRKESIVYRAP